MLQSPTLLGEHYYDTMSTQHSTTYQMGIGLYCDHTGHKVLSAHSTDLSVKVVGQMTFLRSGPDRE